MDTLHAFMRHTLAHFRRETIAFGRRHNAVMERCFLFLVWRNLIKGRSERRPDRTTPAMRLGLTDAPWDWGRLLGRRLFPSRLKVPEEWMRIYRRDWITPAVGRNRRHRCVRSGPGPARITALGGGVPVPSSIPEPMTRFSG